MIDQPRTAFLVAIASAPLLAQSEWRALPGLHGRPSCVAFADLVRGRPVLVAATQLAQPPYSAVSETWEWLGTSWARIETAHRAPADGDVYLGSEPMRLAYDTRRKVGVLFVNGETWEWDGHDWGCREVKGSPGAINHPAFGYDPLRGQTVLFGGTLGASQLTDTWVYDGRSWAKLPATTGPVSRTDAAMVFDPARGKLLLFGGLAGTTLLNDLWEWDGSQWAQLLTSPSPPPRIRSQIVYDAASARVQLFGGGTNSGYLGDQWQWDGVSWQQVTPPTLPEARTNAAFVYSPWTGRTLLSSGRGGGYSGTLNDTWQWDGLAWTLLNRSWPLPGPCALAFDSARDRLVAVAASGNLRQTWEWDGARWQDHPAAPPPLAPPAYVLGVAAFDEYRGVTVFHAGAAGTAEWNGSGWNVPSATGPGLDNAAIAFDLWRGRTVLFGGTRSGVAVGETWEWDGVAWSQRNPTVQPPARARAMLAFDRHRGKTVLFGGQASVHNELGDTWEYDGVTWRPVMTTGAGPARSSAAMVYDQAKRRVVLHGGVNAVFTLRETFEFDGVSWVAGPNGDYAAGHALAYDPVRRRVLAYGGSGLVGPVDTFAEYVPAHPALWSAYGAGCAGSAGTPTLVVGTWPWIGDLFELGLGSVPASQPAAMLLGVSRSTWGASTLPLDLAPLGMPSCRLWTSVELAVPFTPPAFAIAIPMLPALRGQSLFQQALVVDPGVNSLGVVASQGGSATLGAR